MRPRYPKINIKKMQGLNIFDESKFRDSINPLFELLEKLDLIKDPLVINSCKKFIIIKLVTIIEDSFKGILKKQIDVYNGNIKSFFSTRDVRLSLYDFDSIKNDSFTKGSFIASFFNLQNPSVIDQTMSKVLELQFFETIQQICLMKPDDEILNDDIADDAGVSEYVKVRQELADRWIFSRLIDYRNKIVHTLTDIDIDNKTLECYITDTFWYILISEALSFAVGVIKNNSSEQLEELEFFFGIKSSKIKNLILEKRDSYSQATVKK